VGKNQGERAMKKNPPWLVVLVLLPSIAGGYFLATHRPYIYLAGTPRP